MIQQNTICIGTEAEQRSSLAFGPDYLTEMGRVIRTHAPAGPRTFLEWGMGNSTLYFLTHREELGLSELYAMDDNAAYLAGLKETLPKADWFHAYSLDQVGPKKSDRDPEYNFSSLPLSWGRRFDVIYIDGRRRMECALTAAQLCHAGTVVMLHDYRRQRYQSVRFLFDIVEDGSQFRVMRLKRHLLEAEAKVE
jgi:hypothetical protein